jgi:signal peptidase I
MPYQILSALSRRSRLSGLLTFLVLVLMIRDSVWMPVLITGNSMLPELYSGQIAAINKLAYSRQLPSRGDIVAVWTGKDLIIKRIIGLPGEEVSVNSGIFFINGKALQEPYIQYQGKLNIEVGKVATNHLVITGDNRAQTLVAVISRERIVGRLVRLLWTAGGEKDRKAS